ncbi:MAG: hypothetical protein HY444_09485 [Nitrospirae bacterium]|nr:hypothetical protein [Nitrospirota bacterium]
MDLRTLWDQHRAAGWPKFSSPNEGELMTLDTVISGCATYYFDEQGLDAQRAVMLEHCLDDLDTLLPDVPEEAGEYFVRLRALAGVLLETSRHR